MIASFADRASEALFQGETGKAIKRIPSDIRNAAVRKLDMVNAAHELQDLRVPPGNRLEALKGDLRGKHSIRINDQWRIVFRWKDGDAHEVEIDDYHWGVEMLPKNRIPTHPGEILLEDFLKPMGVSQVALADHLDIPVQRINELVRGKRGVTSETAWLLAGALGTTPEFWINLQTNHDLVRNRPRKKVRQLAAAG
jgi:addiction module HigA family antidote